MEDSSNLKQCTKCQEVKRLEDFHDLKTGRMGKHSNCKDCRRAYRKNLQYVKPIAGKLKCEKCNQYVCPQKKINFWELSPVLIFSIKQFRMGKKINQKIQFPELLNMEKYCLSKRSTTNYKLSGICVHSGGLNGGHYYAYCKDYINNKWFKLNDSSVSESSLEEVLNQNAYCLFYIQN